MELDYETPDSHIPDQYDDSNDDRGYDAPENDSNRAVQERMFLPLTRDEVLRSRVLLARKDIRALDEAMAKLLDTLAKNPAATADREFWTRSMESHVMDCGKAITYVARVVS